ncbi:hypothetical protein PG984_002515 [Apiospora sp. TS-2023a]
MMGVISIAHQLDLHKCPDPTKCTLYGFDLTVLVSAVKQGDRTAWLLDLAGPRLATSNEKCIAISHVWSDGTAVGLEGHGRVNGCLLVYFQKLAHSLDCVAIWWDTFLSRWMTGRNILGWTTLELAMPNTVKVLFKGDDSMAPDIKDLDTDILANCPSTASRTHWLASCMIRRVHKSYRRSTSWLRDRTIITGFLARVKWDYDDVKTK